MKYYNSNQSLSAKGVFIGYLAGYATFQLENSEVIYFEQIDKKNRACSRFKKEPS